MYVERKPQHDPYFLGFEGYFLDPPLTLKKLKLHGNVITFQWLFIKSSYWWPHWLITPTTPTQPQYCEDIEHRILYLNTGRSTQLVCQAKTSRLSRQVRRCHRQPQWLGLKEVEGSFNDVFDFWGVKVVIVFTLDLKASNLHFMECKVLGISNCLKTSQFLLLETYWVSSCGLGQWLCFCFILSPLIQATTTHAQALAIERNSRKWRLKIYPRIFLAFTQKKYARSLSGQTNQLAV